MSSYCIPILGYKKHTKITKFVVFQGRSNLVSGRGRCVPWQTLRSNAKETNHVSIPRFHILRFKTAAGAGGGRVDFRKYRASN